MVTLFRVLGVLFLVVALIAISTLLAALTSKYLLHVWLLVLVLVVVRVSDRLGVVKSVLRSGEVRRFPMETFVLITTLSLFFSLFSEIEQCIALGFEEYSSLFNEALGGRTNIFSAVLLSPISEEILFRGMILVFFMKTTSFWRANLLTSLAFCVLHIKLEHVNPLTVFISSFSMSLLLGFLMVRFNSIFVVIVLHSLYNLQWLLYLFILVIFDIKFFDMSDFYMFAVVMFVLISGFVYWSYRILLRYRSEVR